MEENQPMNQPTPRPSRARPKVPKILQSPNGEVIKLTRKMRSIVTRIPGADDVAEIAEEMNCSKGMVYHTMRLPAVQEYLRTQMEAVGITHGLLMRRLREGLDAKKTNTLGDEYTDYGERREHIKLALRLQGLDTTPDPGEGQGVTNNTLFQIVVNAREGRGLPVPSLPASPQAQGGPPPIALDIKKNQEGNQ